MGQGKSKSIEIVQCRQPECQVCYIQTEVCNQCQKYVLKHMVALRDHFSTDSYLMYYTQLLCKFRDCNLENYQELCYEFEQFFLNDQEIRQMSDQHPTGSISQYCISLFNDYQINCTQFGLDECRLFKFELGRYKMIELLQKKIIRHFSLYISNASQILPDKFIFPTNYIFDQPKKIEQKETVSQNQ